uniref:Pecanex-like protein n=1 Tax=Taenia asiatica TaxID=60517 RepID=A0A158R717_TAEAS
LQSEEGEQTWETISIHPDVIDEVNVSSMRLESDDGFVREQIALSISISEPSSNFTRFWEGDNEPDTADGKSVIEFSLNPLDVVKALPDNASRNNHGSQSQQQQQLLELLTGLRAYAEKMFPRATITSSQSSTNCQQQQPDMGFEPEAIFASCRSPLCVEVGKENTPSPSPLPKSFFADPDVSFEESAEGLGFKVTASGDRRPQPMPLFKYQTVRTPLRLCVGPDGIVERRRGSSSTIPAATPASRPINSPFSVASGLETPSPCAQPLEAPNLEPMDASLDEDIASESARKVSTAECPPEKVEKPPIQSEVGTDRPQTSISIAARQMLKRSTPATNLDSIMEEVSQKCDVCDLDEISLGYYFSVTSATESEETPQSQSRVGRARKRVWKKSPSAKHPVTPVEEVSQKGDVYDLNEISDTEDADHQPETKRANLSTFEHFVEENKLELRRKGKREASETGGRDLVEDIVAVLGSAAKQPLRGCRRSIRLAKWAETRVEAAPFDGEDGDGNDDNKASEEDPDKEVLAGSMDVMRHQAAVTLSPLLDTLTAPQVPSQEDLLRDEDPIGESDLSTSQQSNAGEGGEPVFNQCSLVQDSRTPLESTQSIHPRPGIIDAARLLKVVSPPHTPPTALVEVHPDKTPGETVRQLGVESLLESPERARRTAVASDEENNVRPLPIVIPKALSPHIEEDFASKSGEDVNSVKRKAGRLRAIPSVDLDDSKSSSQQPTPPSKSTKRVTIDSDAFLSPIQRPPSSTRRSRRQSRASTATNTTVTTTLTTDANSTLEDSQTINRSAPSPMVMSPFQRLEAAVKALESEEKGAPELLVSSTDLKTSKRLWDTTATYLADESPCPDAAGALTPNDKPPPPGGLIVPAFGNKYFSIAAKLKGDRKSTGKEAVSRRESTKSRASPSRGRRFFASTFAERNKREVEKRFFEVIQKKTANVTNKQKKKSTDGGKQRRKSTSKKKEKKDGDPLDLQLSYLEDSNGVEKEKEEAFRPPKDAAGAGADDDLECRLQSRPAIRRAAAIARSRILETSLCAAEEEKLISSALTLELLFRVHAPAGSSAFLSSIFSKEAVLPLQKLFPRRSRATLVPYCCSEDLSYNDRSSLPSPIPAVRKAAKVELTETAEVRTPGDNSLDATCRRPTLGLFAPTPNTSGVYDFTLSEDDELVKGLPRLGRRHKKGVLKGTLSLLAATPEHSSQPIISAGFLTDMNRCVGVVFSTLNIVVSGFRPSPSLSSLRPLLIPELVESEFSNRLNQLRDQVEEIQRLLRCWQRRHLQESEAGRTKGEDNRVHL